MYNYRLTLSRCLNKCTKEKAVHSPSIFLSPLKRLKKQRRTLSAELRSTSLMQHCGGWKLECHCKLMASNSLVLPLRSASSLDSRPRLPCCLHYCTTAVWCTRSCRGLCRVSPQLASVMSLQPHSSSSQHTVLVGVSYSAGHCTKF